MKAISLLNLENFKYKCTFKKVYVFRYFYKLYSQPLMDSKASSVRRGGSLSEHQHPYSPVNLRFCVRCRSIKYLPLEFNRWHALGAICPSLKIQLIFSVQSLVYIAWYRIVCSNSEFMIWGLEEGWFYMCAFLTQFEIGGITLI